MTCLTENVHQYLLGADETEGPKDPSMLGAELTLGCMVGLCEG